MRIVYDLRMIQEKWFVISDFEYFCANLFAKVSEKAKEEDEIYAVLMQEENMNLYFHALEKVLRREQIKTMCFYPEVREDSDMDQKVFGLYEQWFFSQFHTGDVYVPDYEDINAGKDGCENIKVGQNDCDDFKAGDNWTECIKLRKTAGELDTENLVRQLHPLVRCRSCEYLKALAYSIEDSKLFSEKKRIFIDMSGTVLYEQVTGIQRVVNGFVRGIGELTGVSGEFECVPVYSVPDKPVFFRAVNNGSRYVKQKEEDGSVTVQFHDGDILFMPDLYLDNTKSKKQELKKMTGRGVRVFSYLHDLFPLHYPEEYSETDIQLIFEEYLRMISDLSGVTANSKATLENYLCWCKDCDVQKPAYFKTEVVYLGSDLKNAKPSRGLPQNHEQIMESFRKRTTLLMVGSIAPRKNHELVLDAMELLWNKGVDANLVFVGNAGWQMDEFNARLRNCRDQHFMWLRGISDEFLDRIYHASDGVIFVSEDEGYGLPVVEASVYGKPLLLRDIKIFREIAGDNATYYRGSRDPFLLASAIEVWIGSIQKGKAVTSEGIRRYTWNECSEAILDFINENGSKEKRSR